MKKIIIALLISFNLSSQTVSTRAAYWYNGLDPVPTSSLLTDVNSLVDSLFTDSIWNNIDFLAVIAGMESNEMRLKPLKTTSGNAMTSVNSPTLNLNGVTGNGASSYLRTGWNPSIHGVKYGLYDAYSGVYHTTQGTTASRRFFGSTTNGSMLRMSNGTCPLLNFSSGNTQIHTLDLGLKAMYLTGLQGDTINLYHGSIVQTDIHNPITGLSVTEFFICAASNNLGNPASFTNATIRVVVAGNNKIDSNKLKLRLNTFFAARGLVTY